MNAGVPQERWWLSRVLIVIPITLAVLFAELAGHVGLEVDGIAFPGHFLLRVNLHEGLVVVDPFTGRSLDRDIERTAWLTRAELLQRAGQLRSPLVLGCIDDYLAGQRAPLSAVRCVGLREDPTAGR